MKIAVKRYWEMSDEVIVDFPDETKLTERVATMAVEKAHSMSLSDGIDEPQYVPDSMNSDIETDVQETKL